MNDWMIRTSSLQLLGPYSKQDLIRMIEEGEIQPQDEVCRANHYWFFLHEQDELLKQLGIRNPVHKRGGDTDEITETDVVTTKMSQPAPEIQKTSRPQGSFVSPVSEEKPEAQEAPQGFERAESTIMIKFDPNESIELDLAPASEAPQEDEEKAPIPAQKSAPASDPQTTPTLEAKPARSKGSAGSENRADNGDAQKKTAPVVAAPVESPTLLKGLVSTLIILSLFLLWMTFRRL